MKHVAIAAIVITALLGARSNAQPGPPPPACCACIMSPPCVPTNGTATNALFCAAAPAGNTTALEERCAAMAGGLACQEEQPGTPCRSQLDAAGFVCPAAGVPAAAPLNLAALAVILAAGGAALLRRRRAPRA